MATLFTSKPALLSRLVTVGKWHNNKDYDKLLDGYAELGWTITNKGKHLQCKCPYADKCIVTVASTASDHRALKNTEAALRRCKGE